MHQRVAGPVPSGARAHVAGSSPCGGECGRQPVDVSFSHPCFSPPSGEGLRTKIPPFCGVNVSDGISPVDGVSALVWSDVLL